MYPMFIAELFSMAKTWKQPKYPSIDEWIRRCGVHVHTHTHTHTHTEYYSAIKTNEIMSFAAIKIDLDIITLSKV